MVDLMGSSPKYIRATKAANILGCPVDRVHEYCNQGLVRNQFEGDERLVNQEDIAEIHRLNLAGEMKPGELIRRLLFCERELDRLRMAVNKLYEINNLSASRFSKMSETDLMGMYHQVQEMLGEDEWPIKQMAETCEIFIKITEMEISTINDLLGVDNCWRPFFELCLKMTKYVSTHPKMDTDLDLQRVRDLLYASRKNLSAIAVLFVEKSATFGPSRTLLAKLAKTDLELFDHLARQLKAVRRRGHLEAV